MQSDVVSGDSVVCTEPNPRGDKTLAEQSIDDRPNLEGGSGDEECLERERDFVRMEIDFVGESKMGSSNVEVNIVEGEMGSNAYVGNEGKDFNGGVINQDGSVKENASSSGQCLLPKPLNDDELGGIVNAVGCDDRFRDMEKTVDGSKGLSSVVDSDECVKSSDGKSSKKRGEFRASDLVWGKVRSHPWWPGQIFEPGDASETARKHCRSNSYLVGYFGDQTFAWNDETKLKPFAPHFSQMVKQNNMEAFRHAVDCVLGETSRRVEFGLSCRCIVDDVYNGLKTQVFENAGIREQSIVHEVVERFFTASSFETVKFLDYVKDLAQGSGVDVDRLEYVIARAQMAAFYRWKGIYHLAEFGPLIGYVNNEADSLFTRDKKEMCEVTDGGTIVPGETMEEHDSKPQKRKKMSSDSGHLTKKMGCLSDLVGKKGLRSREEDEKGTEGRQKKAKLLPNESKTKDSSPQETNMPSRDVKPSFSVGESILRVAGQLSRPSPLLKLDVSPDGKPVKAKGDGKKSQQKTKVVASESSSPDVILSHLHLAAVGPLKELSWLNSMIIFLSDFRNSVVQDSELCQKHEESAGEDTDDKSKERPSGCSSGSKSKEKACGSETTTTSDLEAAEDACCTDKTMSDDKMAVVEPEPSKLDGKSAGLQEMDDLNLGSEQCNESENAASERGQFDENMQQEDSPTALTLKFTDMDSIPTEAKLNKIFSHFGPLKESETEVLAKKNCARVVFKRRSDAETAFSSSGKFEIFGPSLVCYRLNYAPSPRKTPSVEAQQKRKDGTLVEGNAT